MSGVFFFCLPLCVINFLYVCWRVACSYVSIETECIGAVLPVDAILVFSAPALPPAQIKRIELSVLKPSHRGGARAFEKYLNFLFSIRWFDGCFLRNFWNPRDFVDGYERDVVKCTTLSPRRLACCFVFCVWRLVVTYWKSRPQPMGLLMPGVSLQHGVLFLVCAVWTRSRIVCRLLCVILARLSTATKRSMLLWIDRRTFLDKVIFGNLLSTTYRVGAHVLVWKGCKQDHSVLRQKSKQDYSAFTPKKWTRPLRFDPEKE